METHPLDFLVNQYLSEKDITRGTYELYRNILKQYLSYLKEHEILYAKTCDVTLYLAFKKSQGYTVRWHDHHVRIIKGFYRYLSNHHLRLKCPEYSKDITENIKANPTSQLKMKSFFTVEEAKQLLSMNETKRKYIWHYRDYAILYLMLTTGQRSVEIRRLKKKDMKNVHGEWILDVHGKGRSSSDAFVKITERSYEAIQDYLKRRKDSNPYLFISHSFHTNIPSLSRGFFTAMLKRALKAAGLEDKNITPHGLRHTAATLNLMRGATLEETRMFMRHTHLSSTLIYAHHIERDSDDSEEQLEKFILGVDES